MHLASVRLGPLANQVLVNISLLAPSPSDGAVLRTEARAPGPLVGAGDVVLRAPPTAARGGGEWQVIGREPDEEPVDGESAPTGGAASSMGPSASTGPVARAKAAATPYASQPQAEPGDPLRLAVPVNVLYRPAAGSTWTPARYYVIVRTPAGGQLAVGIYKVQWSEIAQRLSGGRLFGSGVKLWGYDELGDAQARWVNECPNDEVPLLRIGIL